MTDSGMRITIENSFTLGEIIYLAQTLIAIAKLNENADQKLIAAFYWDLAAKMYRLSLVYNENDFDRDMMNACEQNSVLCRRLG